jgi:hypothetical protein
MEFPGILLALWYFLTSRMKLVVEKLCGFAESAVREKL